MLVEATGRRGLDDFDGAPVHRDEIVIPRKTMSLAYPLLFDEKVQVTMTAIVDQVHFYTDRYGRLVRKHILKLDALHVEDA